MQFTGMINQGFKGRSMPSHFFWRRWTGITLYVPLAPGHKAIVSCTSRDGLTRDLALTRHCTIAQVRTGKEDKLFLLVRPEEVSLRDASPPPGRS
jgi:hypothetical protein